MQVKPFSPSSSFGTKLAETMGGPGAQPFRSSTMPPQQTGATSVSSFATGAGSFAGFSGLGSTSTGNSSAFGPSAFTPGPQRQQSLI